MALWKVGWRRASMDVGELTRRLLRWYRQEVLVAWATVRATDVERNGQIGSVAFRKALALGGEGEGGGKEAFWSPAGVIQ